MANESNEGQEILTGMPDPTAGQQTPSQTGKQSVKEMVEQARKRGKVQSVQAGTKEQADVATANERAGMPVHEVEERNVEPKQFPVSHSKMADIDCYTVVMSFQDVVDYGDFADNLYDAPITVDKDGKETQGKVDVTQRWQRSLTSSRVHSASDYLANQSIHFFPPLVAIPSTPESFKSVSTLNGNQTVTLSEGAIAWLDGQHRAAAIGEALDKNPSLANESIPVVILVLNDLERQQQIFADINRTPRKVSKILNLAFDHSDRVAVVARKIASTMPSLVTMDTANPKKSVSQAMSLSNLYSLLHVQDKKTASGLADLRKPDSGEYLFSDDDISAVVSTIVDRLPAIDALRSGRWTYENVRTEYICYTSTLWQALGKVLGELAVSKNADSQYRYSVEEFPSVVARLMDSLRESWSIGNRRWRDADRPVVQADGRIGTQRQYVDHAVSVIRDFVQSMTE